MPLFDKLGDNHNHCYVALSCAQVGILSTLRHLNVATHIHSTVTNAVTHTFAHL
jgi:hypothetical protein